VQSKIYIGLILPLLRKVPETVKSLGPSSTTGLGQGVVPGSLSLWCSLLGAHS